MIVVIADDITGAAELAGIGLRYGLRVVVADDILSAKETELLVVYTNTRSMTEKDAVAVMTMMTEKAKALHPELIYKKTDSILRGHVLAEMKAQMEVLDVKKGLLIPANPALGRTIKNGQYYINEKPVHEAGFANDPEFPILKSGVKEMLRAGRAPVNMASNNTALLGEGITVGEAQTAGNMTAWATVNGSDTLFAGGASFFDALLRTRYRHREIKQRQTPKLLQPLLFVSGTTFRKNVERIKAMPKLACLMPATVFADSAVNRMVLETWSGEAIAHLQRHGTVLMAVGKKTGSTNPQLLQEKISEAVQLVVQQTDVQEMIVEGGATAYSITKKLGWRAFVPTDVWAQGIVRMQVTGKENLHLTIKPGSYVWPAEWEFENK